MNKLYLVGVGPGDPDLLTIKAKNIIENSKTIFYIENKESNLAFEIIKNFINSSQKLIPLKFSMTANKEIKEKNFEVIKETIKQTLTESDCTFITLGDPAIYSTVYYLIDNFKDQVEVIPGISSFSVLSANLKIPLVIGKQNLAIINLNSSKENIISDLDNNESIIILRIIKKRIKFLKELLLKLKLEKKLIIYSNIGFENEMISTNIDDLNESLSYMTTILIKKN